VSFLRFGFGYFLEDDEKVLRVFRTPALFMLIRSFFHSAIFGGIAYIIWYLYRSYNGFDLTYVWGFFALFALYKVLGAFFIWYYNAIVMTNESLVFIDWKKLFHRSFSRIDFHNLDEIEVARHGVKSFLLNYGTLSFQKVNGGETIAIKGISRPTWASRNIEKYREEIIDNKNFTEESALKGLLSQMVQRHVGDSGQPDRQLEDIITQIEPKIAPVKEKESFFKFFKKEKPKKKKTTFEKMSVKVEKEFDDEGGIEFDLDK